EPRIEAYFHEHRRDFERARLRHIVVREEDEARELMLSLEEGGEFFNMALRHSIDGGTVHAGGYCGWVGRSALSGPEEAAVFGAQAGETVGPFAYGKLWRILRVEQLQTAELNEKVRDDIREALFREWLENEWKQARIE